MTFAASSIKKVFDQAAPHYDVMNNVMSGFCHILWKKIFVSHLPRKSNALWIDIGAGTGDIAQLIYHEHHSLSPSIIACEPNEHMHKLGKQKSFNNGAFSIQWSHSAAPSIPTENASATGLTFGFSLRNIPQWKETLESAFVKAKKNGSIHIMEFNSLAHQSNALYSYYQEQIIPRMGRLLSSAEPYEYLVQSIRNFASPLTLKATLEKAGWEKVEVSYTGCRTVTVLKGVKP